VLDLETPAVVQVFRQHAQQEVAVARYERALDELRRLWTSYPLSSAQEVIEKHHQALA